VFRIDDDAGDGVTAQRAVTTEASTTSPAHAVITLCRRIFERLPNRHVPDGLRGNTLAETRYRLAGFSKSLSPTDSGAVGYQWPGSRLTSGDVQRLNVISNATGLPCNELLHVAVGVLFDQTREVVARLLTTHEQTGRALTELLDDVSVISSDMDGASTVRVADAVQTPPHPYSRPTPRLAAHWHRHGPGAAIEQSHGEAVLVAESPPTGPRVQQLLPFHP
jgi:hypothetical protein